MLKKISLAALVAMGGMSFASATPLTEAIKNVDLNGMLRLRYYNEKPQGENSYSMWRTNAVLIFKIPVAENMSFVMRNSTQTFLTHTEANDGKISTYSGGDVTKDSQGVDSTLTNNLLFLSYHQDNLNVIAGKIPVATSITSTDPATPTHGAGAIATYNVGNGVTVAGAYVEAVKNATADVNAKYIGKAINNDIFALAGFYNNDAVNAQAWVYHVENAIKNEVTLSANIDLFKLANIQNDFNIQFHVDYARASYDDELKTAYNYSDSKNFWNINAKGCFSGATLRIGYAQTSDDKGIISVGGSDAPIASNEAKTQQAYDIVNERDAKLVYADGSYNITDAVKLTLAFANFDMNEKYGDNDANDYTFQVDYTYNKKLSFQAYYDYLDVDANNADNTEVRLQALYKF